MREPFFKVQREWWWGSSRWFVWFVIDYGRGEPPLRRPLHLVLEDRSFNVFLF